MISLHYILASTTCHFVLAGRLRLGHPAETVFLSDQTSPRSNACTAVIAFVGGLLPFVAREAKTGILLEVFAHKSVSNPPFDR